MIGKPEFVEGLQLVRSQIGGWKVHALVMAFKSGGPPFAVAFCDRATLALLHEQTSQALREVDADGLDGQPFHASGGGAAAPPVPEGPCA